MTLLARPFMPIYITFFRKDIIAREKINHETILKQCHYYNIYMHLQLVILFMIKAMAKLVQHESVEYSYYEYKLLHRNNESR